MWLPVSSRPCARSTCRLRSRSSLAAESSQRLTSLSGPCARWPSERTKSCTGRRAAYRNGMAMMKRMSPDSAALPGTIIQNGESVMGCPLFSVKTSAEKKHRPALRRCSGTNAYAVRNCPKRGRKSQPAELPEAQKQHAARPGVGGRVGDLLRRQGARRPVRRLRAFRYAHAEQNAGQIADSRLLHALPAGDLAEVDDVGIMEFKQLAQVLEVVVDADAHLRDSFR